MSIFRSVIKGIANIGAVLYALYNFKRCIGEFDKLCGTSIHSYIPSLIERGTEYDILLSSRYKVKYAQHFLARDTILHYETNAKKERIQKSLIKIFDELAFHPVMKYIIYVNALESANRASIVLYNSINIYHTNSFIYSFLYSLHSFLDFNYQLNDIDGQAQRGHINVYYTKINTSVKEILAHELAHRAYMLVYNNEAEPYDKADLKTEAAYKRILESTKNNIKNLSSKSDAPYLVHFINQALIENKKLYSDESMGKEMIAYYLGKLVIMEDVTPVFPGFKGFIAKHTIPDFIEYIENHPNCNAITFRDIECKVIGDHADL